MPDLYNNDDTSREADRGQTVFNKGLDIATEPLKAKIREKAKEKISEFLSKEAIEAVSSALSGVITTLGSSILIVFALLCAIPLCLFSVKYLFSKSSIDITDSVANAISGAYYEATQDDSIRKTLNSSYGCKFNPEDVDRTSSGGYYYSTEGCEISVSFTPSVDIIAPSVSAYASAVNGTLSYYSDDAQDVIPGLIVDENRKPTGYDTESLPDLYSSEEWVEYKGLDERGMPKYVLSGKLLKRVEKQFKSDLANASSEEFAQNIKKDADTFFSLEGDLSLWEDNSIAPHRFTYYRDACYRIKDPVTGDKIHEKVSMRACEIGSDYYRTEQEPYYVNGYKGSVTIPIYYDLTEYKREELDGVITDLIECEERCVFDWEDGQLQGSDKCTEEEAGRAVNNALFTYYQSSLEFFDVDIVEASKYFGGSFGGVAARDAAISYQSDINWYAYAGTTAKYGSQIANYFWGHALYLRSKSLITGSTSNPKEGCTFFAQMWLYDVYGINQTNGSGGSGSGGNFADVLIAHHPDKFEYGRGPTGGGIVSMRYAGSKNGHVICIDETDKANNRIVYSEGNYDANGGVKIRIECTYEEFYKTFRGKMMTYANPKQ